MTVSSWTQYRTERSVDVIDDVVSRYTLQHFKPDETQPYEEVVEEGETLGTHNYEPKSLSKLYDECKNNVLSKEKETNKYWISVAVDEQTGLLSQCTYFPKNCQDDCSEGPIHSMKVTF